MTDSTVSEAVARPTRTVIQMAPAAVVTELLDVFVINFDERGYAAVFAALTIAFASFQNWREDAAGKGWWFRTVRGDHARAQVSGA